MDWLRRVDRALSGISHAAALAGGAVLLGMMALTVLDVGGRYLLNAPIQGAFELTEAMMSLVVSLGLAHCAVKGGHVAVDLLHQHFPPLLQRASLLVSSALMAGLLALSVWETARHALDIHADHQVTAYLSIPLHPFIWMTAAGLALYFLVVLVGLLKMAWHAGPESCGGR